MVETSHWGDPPGKAEHGVGPKPGGMSQKTYETVFSCALRVTGRDLSRKNGRGTFLGATAYLHFRRYFL